MAGGQRIAMHRTRTVRDQEPEDRKKLEVAPSQAVAHAAGGQSGKAGGEARAPGCA